MDSGLKYTLDSIDDSQLRALSLWAQQSFEHIDLASSRDRRRKIQQGKVLQLRTKVFILACLGHIRLVNTLIDGSLVKALCMSYLLKHYNGTPGPLDIFKFISQRFAVLHDIPDDCARFGRGRMVFRLMRCLQIHKGSCETLAMVIGFMQTFIE